MKLGIDMGGMSIKMGLVNEENKIIGRITIPTDLTVPYQTLVERMQMPYGRCLKMQA